MTYDGTALTIAGSDPSGGAGIQADIKTFEAFNIFGMSVVTSVTAQNRYGVRSRHDVPPSAVADQIDMVFEDTVPDAVKTGMLPDPGSVLAVAERMRRYGIVKLVVDPVVLSTSGDELSNPGAIEKLIEELLPLALLVTPNIQEAELLSGIDIAGGEDVNRAARAIQGKGAQCVLVKGGHLPDAECMDTLFDGRRFTFYKRDRIGGEVFRGTGCTLSAAITASLSRGEDIGRAVGSATDYISRAIGAASSSGSGLLRHNLDFPAGHER